MPNLFIPDNLPNSIQSQGYAAFFLHNKFIISPAINSQITPEDGPLPSPIWVRARYDPATLPAPIIHYHLTCLWSFISPLLTSFHNYPTFHPIHLSTLLYLLTQDLIYTTPFSPTDFYTIMNPATYNFNTDPFSNQPFTYDTYIQSLNYNPQLIAGPHFVATSNPNQQQPTLNNPSLTLSGAPIRPRGRPPRRLPNNQVNPYTQMPTRQGNKLALPLQVMAGLDTMIHPQPNETKLSWSPTSQPTILEYPAKPSDFNAPAHPDPSIPLPNNFDTNKIHTWPYPNPYTYSLKRKPPKDIPQSVLNNKFRLHEELAKVMYESEIYNFQKYRTYENYLYPANPIFADPMDLQSVYNRPYIAIRTQEQMYQRETDATTMEELISQSISLDNPWYIPAIYPQEDTRSVMREDYLSYYVDYTNLFGYTKPRRTLIQSHAQFPHISDMDILYLSQWLSTQESTPPSLREYLSTRHYPLYPEDEPAYQLLRKTYLDYIARKIKFDEAPPEAGACRYDYQSYITDITYSLP